MKHTHKMAFAIIALCSVAGNAFGYVYSYSNKTNKQMQVRVQLGEKWEEKWGERPWYYVGPDPYKTEDASRNVLAPGATSELRFLKFEGPPKYSRRFGFCIETQEYRVLQHGKWTEWVNIPLGGSTCRNRFFKIG